MFFLEIVLQSIVMYNMNIKIQSSLSLLTFNNYVTEMVSYSGFPLVVTSMYSNCNDLIFCFVHNYSGIDAENALLH